MGWRLHAPDMTPAGIKQAYPMHPKAPAHIRWTLRAIRGLVYMVTDKGPKRQWLWEYWKDGGAVVRVRWMDTTEGSAPPTLLVGGKEGQWSRCGEARRGVKEW